MTKTVSKIFLYLLGVLLLMMGALAIYSQTSLFRSNLQSILYKVIESNLNASVYLGEINGNLISGFTIDTVMVYVDNAPFVESGRISLHYDAFDLLRNKISVNSIQIENPSINLIRSKNGVWNVSRLDTTASQPDSVPSAIVVNVEKIAIRNASFRLIDSTGDFNSSTTIEGNKTVNYSNLKITNLNLDSKVFYSAKKISAVVKSLSLKLPREKFVLDNLSTDVLYTKDSAIVKELTIETPNSKISMEATLLGVEVLKATDLKKFQGAPTKVTVVSSTVAMNDLQIFLPSLYFLKGKIFLDAQLQGTFDQLSIKKFDASFAQTTLRFSGSISDLHTPKDLHLNIVSKQSEINPADIPALMPYFRIPDYSSLGKVTMDFQYVGRPLDFMVVSTIKSAAGLVKVDGEMIITEDNLHYKGLLAGTDVNLEKIFTTSDFVTHLNTKAYIKGEGTSIDKLNAEARIEIDSSSIRGIPVSSAALELKAKEKKIDAQLTVASPDGQIVSNGNIDFTRTVPSYSVSATANGLNLAPIFRDEYYQTRLSFNIQRSAESLDLLAGNSQTRVEIYPSVFQHSAIDSAHAVVKISVDSLHKRTISVQSPVADGEISGFFTFAGFLKTLERNVKKMSQLYSYQRHIVDSTFIVQQDSIENIADDTTTHRMKYDFLVKNLRPVTLFFKLPQFDAQGTLAGVMEGNNKTASMGGKINLQKFLYDQDSTSIQGKNINVEYSISDKPKFARSVVLPMTANIQSTANELLIGKTLLRFVNFQMNVDDSIGSINAYSDLDTTISVGAEGKMFISPLSERFDFSKMFVKYRGYLLSNDGALAVQMDQKGITVDSASFLHRAQTVSVAGQYEFDGRIRAKAAVKGFEFSDLSYFTSSSEFKDYVMNLGGTINADAEIQGSLNDPHFRVSVKGDSLSYQQSPWGNLSAIIDYAKTLASINVEISNSPDSSKTKDIVLKGHVPIDLRLVDVPDRLNFQGLDVSLSTSNLQFSTLDPFIPELKEITGRIKSAIHVGGSMKKPIIDGTATLEEGHFVFEMNGLRYDAAGTLLFDSNRVRFPALIVSNVPSDYSEGKMNIGGHIVMNGFVPNQYHLTAKGELLILSDRSRSTGSTFFGTLVASTGSDSLRFDGSFDRSHVAGIVYIQQGFLTFPPTQQATSYSSSVINTVEFVDDTSKPKRDTSFVETIAKSIQAIAVVPLKSEKTFLDGFGYELTIQTRGPVRVDMVFNANAGAYEELYAELNGKLVLSKSENGVQLKGTINVGNESNYTFYKKFNASGSLTFVGDPQNPQLNILATYEGTHQPFNDEKKTERAVVTLTITGNRIQPKLKIGLKTIDQSGKETERTGDVENDAVSFLLTSSTGVPGKFRDELTADDQKRIADQLSNVSLTFVNSMLSSYVMEFVQKNNIPFVKSFEVRQVGADPDVRFGLEFLDATINAGGRVFSDVNNANISFQYPLGDKQKRNFMLEIEKKTENFDYSIQARTSFGARIFYRFTF